MANKVEKLVIKAEDKPEIKAHKSDVINALITWHDRPDKKDFDTDGKEIIFNYNDYEETIKIALDSLLRNNEINSTQAQDIISYLSDDKARIKGDIDLSKGSAGIKTEKLG